MEVAVINSRVGSGSAAPPQTPPPGTAEWRRCRPSVRTGSSQRSHAGETGLQLPQAQGWRETGAPPPPLPTGNSNGALEGWVSFQDN